MKEDLTIFFGCKGLTTPCTSMPSAPKHEACNTAKHRLSIMAGIWEANRQPTVSQPSPNRQPTASQPSANSQPTVSQQSANRQPANVCCRIYSYNSFVSTLRAIKHCSVYKGDEYITSSACILYIKECYCLNYI